MPNTRDGFKLLPTSIGVPRGDDGGRGDHAFRPEHGLSHQSAHQGKILIDIIMDKWVLGVLGDCMNEDSVLLFVTLCYSSEWRKGEYWLLGDQGEGSGKTGFAPSHGGLHHQFCPITPYRRC